MAKSGSILHIDSNFTIWIKVDKSKDGIPTPEDYQEWEYHNGIGGIFMTTRPKEQQPKDLKDPLPSWI